MMICLLAFAFGFVVGALIAGAFVTSRFLRALKTVEDELNTALMELD